MTLNWYMHFQRNGRLNQILRRQTSLFHYGSKVPAVTIGEVAKRKTMVYKILFPEYIQALYVYMYN